MLYCKIFVTPGCCVYVKPRAFDESESDDSDGECNNCSGHVEKKKANKQEDSAPSECPVEEGEFCEIYSSI